MSGEVDFSDLDDLDSAPVKAKSYIVSDEIKCIACCGSGVRTYGYVNMTSYPCGICRGTGKVTAQRLRNIDRAKQAEKTRQSNAAKKRAEFAEKYPKHLEWMQRNAANFDFASSLLEQYNERGRLSEGQMAAIERCMDREAVRRQEKQKEREAASKDVAGASNVMDAFRRAQANQIKRPKMRFEGVIFSLAPDSGRNAGSIYVTIENEYAGRITDGKFLPTNYGAKQEAQSKLEPIFIDPLKEAVAYGKRTGTCSCCGRQLDNHESIELGIGPICRSKFF